MADQTLANLLIMIFMLQTGLHASTAARIETHPLVEVIEGTRTLLSCVIRFDDEPYGLVVWSREPAPDGEDFIVVYDLGDREGLKITSGPDSERFDMVAVNNANFSLVMKNPRKEDEGTYYCQFDNLNAQLTSSNQTVVYVIGKPTLLIAQCQDQMLVSEGSSICKLTHPYDQPLQLDCQLIHAKNEAFLYWMRDDEEGSCSSRNSIADGFSYNSSAALSLREEQLCSGYRHYTCLAEGGYIDDTLQAMVVVHITAIEEQQAPHCTPPTLSQVPGQILDKSQSDGWKDFLIVILTALLILAVIYCNRRKLRILFERKKKAPRHTIDEENPPNDQEPLLELGSPTKGKKFRSDPIHNTMIMPGYCQIFIDTPQFQRMRYIKQLGCACYVYHMAVHTRFDHSIGVCHLAGKLIATLRENGAEISDSDARCVRIAGLCHDLGHGPFSHDFESIISAIKKGTIWKHEEKSVKIFEDLVENNGLKDQLTKKFGIGSSHLDLIRRIILGDPKKGDDRFYLIQIVNNWKNGIDVDKWDYMKRDSSFTGIDGSDIDLIFESAKVSQVQQRDGTLRKEICFPIKVRDNIYSLFSGRQKLHKKAYKHRVVSSIMFMIRDALTEACKEPQNTRKDGAICSLLKSVEDLQAFCQLDDYILNEISRSESDGEGIRKAKEIIDRIHRRDIYKCLVEIENAETNLKSKTQDVLTLQKWIKKNMVTPDSDIWKEENIEVEVCHFDTGYLGRNPSEVVPFEIKVGECRYLTSKEVATMPKTSKTSTVRIYTKVSSIEHGVIQEEGDTFMRKARSKGLYKGELPSTPKSKRSPVPRDLDIATSSQCPDPQETEANDEAAASPAKRQLFQIKKP